MNPKLTPVNFCLKTYNFCGCHIFIVKKMDKYGIISGKGELLQSLIYDSIKEFHMGGRLYFFVEKEGKEGIININGDELPMQNIE